MIVGSINDKLFFSDKCRINVKGEVNLPSLSIFVGPLSKFLVIYCYKLSFTTEFTMLYKELIEV